jgi:hypothetical protein
MSVTRACTCARAHVARILGGCLHVPTCLHSQSAALDWVQSFVTTGRMPTPLKPRFPRLPGVLFTDSHPRRLNV